MVCREQVGSGWGNVLRTTETQKAKPSGVREVPRILRSVVHAKPSGVRVQQDSAIGGAAADRRETKDQRRDGMAAGGWE